MTKVHKLIIVLINLHLLGVISEFGQFLVGFTTGPVWLICQNLGPKLTENVEWMD